MKNKGLFLSTSLLTAIFMLAACASLRPEPAPTTKFIATPTSTPAPTPTLSPADIAQLACNGKGFPGAATYNEKSDAIHPTFVANLAGNKHDWNRFLPALAQAGIVETLEAVLCVGEQAPYLASAISCGRYQSDGGGFVDLSIGRYEIPFRLVAAKTGKTIIEQKILGDISFCPSEVSTADPRLIDNILYSIDVRYDNMLSELLPFIIPESVPLLIEKGLSDSVIALSPAGKFLASKGGEKEITLWEVNNTPRPWNSPVPASPSTRLAFSHDGSLLASVSKENNTMVILWDTGSEQIRQEIMGPSAGISTIALSPDGKKLAIAGSDQSVNIWDVESVQVIQKLDTESTVSADILAFSADGGAVASTDSIFLNVWDVATGAKRVHTLASGAKDALAFLPDNKHLIGFSIWGFLAPDTATLRLSVFDAETGNLLDETSWETPFPLGWIHAYLPERNWVVARNVDGTSIFILDFDKKVVLARLGNDLFSEVALTPDGRYLARQTSKGDLLVWDLSWLLESK